MPHTTAGFRTTAQLMDHFQRHGHEFSFTTPQEYQAAAIALFARELSVTLLECMRPSCDIARFDLVLEQFGVLSYDSFIRTLYRPRPQSSESRRDYFARQCGQN